MKLLYIFLIFILMCSSASAATTPIYTENFDGTSLNSSMWQTFLTSGKTLNITVGDGLCTMWTGGSTFVQGIKTNYTANWTRVYIDNRLGPNQTNSRYQKFAVSTNASTGFTVSSDVLTPVNGFLVKQENNYIYIQEYKNGATNGSQIASTTQTGTWGSEIDDIFVNSTGFYCIKDYGTANQLVVSKAGSFDGITAFAFGQGDYTTYAYRAIQIDKINFYSEYVQPSPPPTITYSPSDNAVSTNHYSSQDFSFSSNQPVDYTFFLDGEIIGSGTGSTWTYSNTSNVVGEYNITATIYNENMTAGNNSKTWTWTVNELPPESPEPVYFPSNEEVSTYENLDTDFSLTCSNTLADFAWTLDGVPVESTDTEITSEYTLPAQSAGTYNLTVNVSNEAGSDIHSWTVTYLENSMTIDPLYYNSTPVNGTIFIFNASNFTDGVKGWSPRNFNTTIEGNVYKWIYENGTVISSKTAASSGEALDFDSSEVPEGIYKIGVVPVAAFTGTPTSGTVNTSIVTFTDGSEYATTWYWDFENDGIFEDTYSSTPKTPTHAYTMAGLYSVNLIVSNEYGSNSEVKNDYILVNENAGVDPLKWDYWRWKAHKWW